MKVTSGQQRRNTGAVGSGPHLVRRGECLFSIAFRYGFSWETIWELPANAELRQTRQDPGELFVGDRLVIPEREAKFVDKVTEQQHVFVKRGVPAKLRLVVEYEDEPVSNSAYLLRLDGSLQEGKTDDQGLLEVSIPPDAAEGVLEISGLSFALSLGALDPSSEDFGIQQRLANLGFYHGQVDGQIGPLTREAIAAFQERTGLDLTGELDEATLDQLLHRHDETHERLSPRDKTDESLNSPGGHDG